MPLFFMNAFLAITHRGKAFQGLSSACGSSAWFCWGWRSQSSPNSSAGCWVRSEPLPQASAFAGQYRSQPQQMRSGWLGLCGNFLAMAHAPFWPGDFRLREMRGERLMGVNGGNKKRPTVKVSLDLLLWPHQESNSDLTCCSA